MNIQPFNIMKKLKDKKLNTLIENKDYEAAKALMDEDFFLIISRDKNSITLINYLCYAESDEDKEKNIELLDYIYTHDELNHYIRSSFSNNFSIFNFCLCCNNKNAHITCHKSHNCHPLYTALKYANGNYIIVDYLLEHGVNINNHCNCGYNMFIEYLFTNNDIELLKYLEHKGFNFSHSLFEASTHLCNSVYYRYTAPLHPETVMFAINKGAHVIDISGIFTPLDDYLPELDTKKRIEILDCVEKNGHDLSSSIYYYGASTIRSLLELDDLNVMKWLYENNYIIIENYKLSIYLKKFTDGRVEVYHAKNLSIYGQVFVQIMKDDKQKFGDKYMTCLHGQYFDSNIEYLRPFYIYDKSCIDKYTNSLPEDTLTKIQEEYEKIDYTEVYDILLDKLKEKSLVDDIINDKKEDDYIDLLIKHS